MSRREADNPNTLPLREGGERSSLSCGARAAALLCVFLLLAGCATKPKADDEPHPVWPAPPAPPRIIHRDSFRGVEKLARPSFFDQLGNLITGGRPQRLGEPNSVAVRAGDMLVISDQQAQGVHVFDLDKGRSAFIDRIGPRTHFVSPVGVAIHGDLLAVSDSALNHVSLLRRDGTPVRPIRKPDGYLRATALAFDRRPGVDLLYVADTGAHRVHVFNLDGELMRTVGEAGSDLGQFNFPTHLHVDEQGRLYVTDSLNFRVQVFDAEGRFLFDLGRHGDASGYFGVPKGVAVDSRGHIYVVDSYFSNVQVFDGRGRFLLSFGEPGHANGQFDVPTGIAIDAADRIYVADSQNRRVQVFQYIGGDEPATDGEGGSTADDADGTDGQRR